MSTPIPTDATTAGSLSNGVRAPVVQRSALSARWLLGGAVVALVVLATMPGLVSAGTTALLVNVFILLTMATMWNLLAGYAGVVSIGQQAFIGLGAYAVVIFADGGINPIASLPLAALAGMVIAIPVSYLVFRLRGGYFAIATWVVANTFELIISSISSIGGGTGHPVAGLSSLDPATFNRLIYWVALAVVVAALAGTYLLLRSRLGLVLAAVRDDEVSARSAGVQVMTARRVVFAVAALGCAAAGALLAISQLQVEPTAVFNVSWSAEMIFVTVIGGLGTIEGPILGTIVFFVLQQNLARYGAWYLIIFGAVAVAVAIYAPGGIWGLVSRRFRIELFPVGYTLREPDGTELSDTPPQTAEAPGPS